MKFFVGITCFQWSFGHFKTGKYMPKIHLTQPEKNLTAMCSHKPISATCSQSLNKYIWNKLTPYPHADAIKKIKIGGIVDDLKAYRLTPPSLAIVQYNTFKVEKIEKYDDSLSVRRKNFLFTLIYKPICLKADKIIFLSS